jgi:hypothetical protein
MDAPAPARHGPQEVHELVVGAVARLICICTCIATLMSRVSRKSTALRSGWRCFSTRASSLAEHAATDPTCEHLDRLQPAARVTFSGKARQGKAIQ